MRLALNNKSVFTESKRVRFWPKADTRGRLLGPKIGYPAFFGLLSGRFRPKADIHPRLSTISG